MEQGLSTKLWKSYERICEAWRWFNKEAGVTDDDSSCCNDSKGQNAQFSGKTFALQRGAGSARALLLIDIDAAVIPIKAI